MFISFNFRDIENLGEVQTSSVIPATTLLTDTFCAMLLPMCILEFAYLNIPASCAYQFFLAYGLISSNIQKQELNSKDSNELENDQEMRLG